MLTMPHFYALRAQIWWDATRDEMSNYWQNALDNETELKKQPFYRSTYEYIQRYWQNYFESAQDSL